MNGVAERNLITDLRMKLKSTVYQNQRFIEYWVEQITKLLPVYSCEFDPISTSMRITIDKNLCTTIPGFEHKKEFYLALIAFSLSKTITTTYTNYCGECEDRVSDNYKILHDIIIESHPHPELIYKLFDATVILDNVIIIYL